MIVADTNLVAQLILKLDRTSEALEVYRKDSDWRLPQLWRHEFLNVLASYLRFDRVPIDRLMLAWEGANRLFADCICEVDMPGSLKLAGERNITAYDAQYLWLARSMGVPLITEDRRLLRSSPKEATTIKRFLTSYPGA
jgi:predicted nucleic acid-binding protein